jgi:hypothetical protein
MLMGAPAFLQIPSVDFSLLVSMVYNYHNTYEYYPNKGELQKLFFISL